MSTQPDILDSLSDPDLNLFFALEVAKTHEPFSGQWDGAGMWEGQRDYRRKSDGEIYGVVGSHSIGSGYWSNYCAHHESVFPSLTQLSQEWNLRMIRGEPQIILHFVGTFPGVTIYAFAPTIGRAAVIAGIRAARVVEAAKSA